MLILVSQIGFAQEKPKFFSASGSVSLSYGFYDFDAENYSSFRPRYLQNIVRFNANMNIKLGKYFSLPFGISVSNQNTSYNLPSVPNEKFFSWSYITNPRNNLHIDPTYKWITVHLGSHTPSYSPLTSGDIQIFGAGVELNPGKFIFSANYGVSQVAIEADSARNIRGSYKQIIYGGQIGYGKKQGPTKVVLNYLMLRDDANSVVNKPVGVNPREGATFSPLIEIQLFKTITLKTETAGSVYTKNSEARAIPTDNEFVTAISKYLALNTSSAIDFGHTTSLEWKAKKVTLGGEVNYIGPGFMPVGYYGAETDIFDYKVNAGFRLFKNKLNASGTFGIRTNNLSNTVIQSTRRIIGNGNIFYQITKAFSISTNYNNFNFTNNQDLNTQRVELYNHTFSFTPSLTLKAKASQHVIISTYALNNFDQYDATANDFLNTVSHTGNLNYMLIFQNMPLTLGASGLYLNNASVSSTLEVYNVGINAGYKFLDKKIKTSIRLAYSNIKSGAFTAHNKFNTVLGVDYKIIKKLTLKLSYLLNYNHYGSIRPGASLIENRFNVAINYSF